MWKVYMITVFLLTWVFFFPPSYYYLRSPEYFPKAFRVKRLWCQVLSIFFLTRFDIQGDENLPEGGAFIACINHQSYLDIIFMYPVIPNYFKFIGKIELRNWLLIGVFFRKGMDISVSRENAKQARLALEEAKEALRGGVPVAIFPEGVIPDDTPRLKRFKNGAFKIAVETNVPILPITFIRNHKRLGHPYDPFSYAYPGKCEVVIHPVINTQGTDLMDIAPLRERVYDVINGPLVDRGLSNVSSD